MIKRIAEMTAIAAVIAALICPRASGAKLSPAIALRDVKWTSAEAGKNVVFGAKKWTGAKDLSFKYRMLVEDGVLYVQVDAADDKVVLKKADTVASDHVELWLADADLTDSVAGKIASVDTFLEETLEKVIEDEGDSREVTGCDEFRDTLQEVRYTAATLKGAKHYAQLIFNDGKLLALPEGRGAAAKGVSFAYKAKAGGYLFEAVVPLAGLFDALGPQVSKLGWLVDVSDVDSAAAAKQESLMSSSPDRNFGDAASFSRMILKEPVDLPVTPYTDLLSLIEPNAMLATDPAAPGGYIIMRDPGLFVTDCHYWVLDEVPAEPVRFSVQPLKEAGGWKENDAMIYGNGTRIGVLVGDNAGIVNLSDVLSGSGGFEYSLLHRWDYDDKKGEPDGKHPYFGGTRLLLKVSGASRYPMGNGMCGAGFEVDAVYVDIGADMNVKELKAEPIESCFKNITTDEITFRMNDTAASEGDVVIKYEKFDYDVEKKAGITTHNKLIYTSYGPAPGFTIETTGTEEQKD